MNQGMPAAAVPKAIIACINRGWPDEKYQRDQIVFFQGGPADSVYYVQSGRVKVAVVSGEGKEAVVAILLPGSFCGEECLTGHTLRMSTARAFPECGLIRMAKAGVVRALHEDQQFSKLFTTYLIQRNIRVQEDWSINCTTQSKAGRLLILANRGKEERPEPIVPRINQETLAEMIGTSRTRQFLHEQVSQTRLRRVQWRHQGQQVLVKPAAARKPQTCRVTNLYREVADAATTGRRSSDWLASNNKPLRGRPRRAGLLARASEHRDRVLRSPAAIVFDWPRFDAEMKQVFAEVLDELFGPEPAEDSTSAPFPNAGFHVSKVRSRRFRGRPTVRFALHCRHRAALPRTAVVDQKQTHAPQQSRGDLTLAFLSFPIPGTISLVCRSSRKSPPTTYWIAPTTGFVGSGGIIRPIAMFGRSAAVGNMRRNGSRMNCGRGAIASRCCPASPSRPAINRSVVGSRCAGSGHAPQRTVGERRRHFADSVIRSSRTKCRD